MPRLSKRTKQAIISAAHVVKALSRAGVQATARCDQTEWDEVREAMIRENFAIALGVGCALNSDLALTLVASLLGMMVGNLIPGPEGKHERAMELAGVIMNYATNLDSDPMLDDIEIPADAEPIIPVGGSRDKQEEAAMWPGLSSPFSVDQIQTICLMGRECGPDVPIEVSDEFVRALTDFLNRDIFSACHRTAAVLGKALASIGKGDNEHCKRTLSCAGILINEAMVIEE